MKSKYDYDSGFGCSGLIALGVMILQLGFVVLVIYVAHHFISKWW